VEAVAAVPDEADLGVQSLEPGMAQPEPDRGEDAVAVFADRAGEGGRTYLPSPLSGPDVLGAPVLGQASKQVSRRPSPSETSSCHGWRGRRANRPAVRGDFGSPGPADLR
jgi:hypothetical protein